jgi:hypothetical protein
MMGADHKIESGSGSPGLREKEWFLFTITFAAFALFFLIFSGYQFLDGDDAMQAIWTMAKQAGVTNTDWIPFHGYQTRSGTFLLIYCSSFIFSSPVLGYCILCALSSALVVASLFIYTNAVLGTKARLSQLVVLACVVPEIIYAGLYMNAAVVGYGFGFPAILLSIRLVQKNKSSWWFIFSGALFGLALASAMNAVYLALCFPLHHLFLKKEKDWGKVFAGMIVETVAGAAIYSLVLASMGLSPLAPFLEYGSVMEEYGPAGITYAVITLLGALHPLTYLIVPLGLLVMLKRKLYLPLAAGILTSLPYFLSFAKVLKTLQHGLCVFIIVAFCALLIWEILKKPALKAVYALVLLLPLLIGLRLYLPEQPHRGPGFTELDTGRGMGPEDRDREGLGGFKIFQSPRINIKGRGIRLALGSGFMLPTVDGGRALGGQFWAWVFDWRKYLQDSEKSIDLMMESKAKNIIAGQYNAAMILMYKLVEQGYVIDNLTRIEVLQDDYKYNIFWADVFPRGGNKEKKFTVYWFYIELGDQVGREVINFGPIAQKVDDGIFVTFPTFAYKLEKGQLSIRDFSAQPLGYFCFHIRKKP